MISLFKLLICFCASTIGSSVRLGERDGSGGGGLRWRDLSISLPTRKNGTYLVEPSSGFVQNGHVLAIIGPSGKLMK